MQSKLGMARPAFDGAVLPPFTDEEVQYNKARGRKRDEENAQQRDVRPPEGLRAQPKRRENRRRRDVELNSVLCRSHVSDQFNKKSKGH